MRQRYSQQITSDRGPLRVLYPLLLCVVPSLDSRRTGLDRSDMPQHLQLGKFGLHHRSVPGIYPDYIGMARSEKERIEIW